jgi:hypothetical protein
MRHGRSTAVSPETGIQVRPNWRSTRRLRQKDSAHSQRTSSATCFRCASDEIIERAFKLPVKIGSTLFPRISRWDAQHMNAALAAVQAPLMVIQSTYMGATLKRQSRAYRNRFRGRALRSHVGRQFGSFNHLCGCRLRLCAAQRSDPDVGTSISSRSSKRSSRSFAFAQRIRRGIEPVQ